ncbi:MAG TPA: ATP-dependent sacrificial sulfur transferase LarE [Anaerolineaceae bacterium]
MQIEESTRQLAAAGMNGELIEKWSGLEGRIQIFPAAAVAYSGGVDSSFLAWAAYQVLGEKMIAVTVGSKAEAIGQLAAAARFAEQHGIEQLTIAYDHLQNPDYRSNPADRCYHCKSAILTLVWEYAREHDIPAVFEGQNADDQGDYRPGRKAVAETGTLSPLADSGLTKAEIRELARAFGLSIWDQPSSPCLASRIPYGTPITEKSLRQIALGEDYLHRQGYKICRVRYHNQLARIEVPPEQIARLVSQREELVRAFKEIGFLYVSVDLQGYRLGSLNEGLAR